MRNLLEKVNETVLELWTGILIWGAACQLIPIWFIKDKGGYSLGLWIGVILASAAAFHMCGPLTAAWTGRAPPRALSESMPSSGMP